MSFQGPHSSLYIQIRQFAELLDQVLLDFKAGTPDAHQPERVVLGTLLSNLERPGKGELRGQLLANLIRDSGRPSPEHLAELGRNIVSGTISASLVAELEQLARNLEQERAGTFAKIRGG